MASPLVDAVKRLRTENETMHIAAQEQERTIMLLRSQLSEERAQVAMLKKKLSSKESANG